MASRRKDNERIWATVDRSRSPPQREFARRMGSEPTEAERKLWWHLRHRIELRDTHFRRQVRIGPYIADFASHGLKLIVEIDGSQHAERESDLTRTRRLEANGYCVLRFWNNDVLSNVDGVLDVICAALRTPAPDPSPQGGGEKE